MSVVPYGENPGSELASRMLVGVEALPGTTDAEKVRGIYDELGLDDLLHKFTFGEPLTPDAPDIVDEDMVDHALFKYTFATTFVATHGATAQPDMKVIRDSFDHVYSGIDAAIEAKLNPPATGFLQRLLAKVDMVEVDDAPRRHIAPLDDHFWDEQFPAEMQKQTFVKREPGEPEAWFLARNVYFAMHTKVLSHFSYSQQATRFASY